MDNYRLSGYSNITPVIFTELVDRHGKSSIFLIGLLPAMGTLLLSVLLFGAGYPGDVVIVGAGLLKGFCGTTI